MTEYTNTISDDKLRSAGDASLCLARIRDVMGKLTHFLSVVITKSALFASLSASGLPRVDDGPLLSFISGLILFNQLNNAQLVKSYRPLTFCCCGGREVLTLGQCCSPVTRSQLTAWGGHVGPLTVVIGHVFFKLFQSPAYSFPFWCPQQLEYFVL